MMGIVLVAFLAAIAAVVAFVMITSTLRRTSSSASPNFSPIEENKAALRGIKVVSPNSYAQGEERPYGNRVYNRTAGISATGASCSDREI
jgi:predicted lipid-binding transport protein (Tim44 family)